MVEQMREGDAGNGDAEVVHVGEVGLAEPTRLMDLLKDDLTGGASLGLVALTIAGLRGSLSTGLSWWTPVIQFRRTATVDTELGGVKISAGDKVVVFFMSANRDERVFDRPERFDITRNPNPHLGFGGSGAHYCIGASLARLEIDLIFNAIAEHMPGIRQVAKPRRLRSPWLNGIKEYQVAYG